MENISMYLERLEEKVFGGENLKQLENSLYQVGDGTRAVVAVTKPNSEEYFYSINASHVQVAENVVLVLGHQTMAAVKIPTELFKRLPLHFDLRRGWLVTIAYDNVLREWVMRLKKDGTASVQLITLKTDEEIQMEAIGLRAVIEQKRSV